MPDRADVEQALAALVAGLIYPNGTEAAPAIGRGCRVYRGWPVAGVIEDEVAAGVSHVTVRAEPRSVRDRTRFPVVWQGATLSVTLVATAAAEVVTFTGFGGAGHVAGIRTDGRGYAYRLRDGDSPSLVAAVLADLIRADRPALASGPAVIVPGARGLTGRVVTDGVGGAEVRRQEALFLLSLWCPDPAVRDEMAALIDASAAGWTFIDVGGWACRLRFAGDSSSDTQALSGIWRRELSYLIEYPTTTSETLPSMLFGVADVNDVPFTE